MNLKKLDAAIPLYDQLKNLDAFIIGLEKRIESVFNSDAVTLITIKERKPKQGRPNTKPTCFIDADEIVRFQERLMRNAMGSPVFAFEANEGRGGSPQIIDNDFALTNTQTISVLELILYMKRLEREAVIKKFKQLGYENI